jgi:alpha-L-fucosidase
MLKGRWNRRRFLSSVTTGGLAACAAANLAAAPAGPAKNTANSPAASGSQRLSLEQLRRWESLRYGMFIHFGMSTFDRNEHSDGKAPASAYAPDRLDVDQWVSVARDAGMKYIVLAAKHVAGFCLWPSKHTNYTVANGTNKTNVIEAFCKSCEKRGVLPGLYYCSFDNHNRFGSKTPSDVKTSRDKLPPFTTSLYQNFQTAQITELLTQFGPIAETWIDIPSVLGRGYRTFLYGRIADLQPQTIIMMNSGMGDGVKYDVASAWPSDLIAIERNVPPAGGHQKWREIEGNRYYMPGEVCDFIGGHWFGFDGDAPRTDDALLKQFNACQAGGANFLLNVPPDRHGVIPDELIAALTRLRKSARPPFS